VETAGLSGSSTSGSFVAGGERVSLAAMSRAIAGPPPDPGQQLTPGGRRRAGRPVKQQA
jgi:hypothetical protein